MSLSYAVSISGFVLAGALVVLLEVLGRRDGSRVPTLGDLCAFVMRYQVGPVPIVRIALLGFWWWMGYHFFAR